MANAGVDTELQLGDFKLLRKLGEGAAGVVYRARQISFERDAAVKVLFKTKPKDIERFYREARLAGSLDHPHIVQGYAVGEERGLHYFAMEYVSGHSLQHWLEKLGRLPVGEAVHVALAVARALEYAHAQNLVHRDVKPANVLIGRDAAIKITDLGMAKIRDVDLAELTRTGRGLGTPCYMPIEQFVNAKDADARCDVYALGCMLYALLIGQPPFVSPSFMELIQAKEAGKFPPARLVNPEVPDSLDAIITRMAARRPEDRYQSCTDVIRALEALGLAAARLQFQRAGQVKRTPEQSPISAAGSAAVPSDLPPRPVSMPLAEMPTYSNVKVATAPSSRLQPALQPEPELSGRCANTATGERAAHEVSGFCEPAYFVRGSTGCADGAVVSKPFWHWLAWFTVGVGVAGAIFFGVVWLLVGF